MTHAQRNRAPQHGRLARRRLQSRHRQRVDLHRDGAAAGRQDPPRRRLHTVIGGGTRHDAHAIISAGSMPTVRSTSPSIPARTEPSTTTSTPSRPNPMARSSSAARSPGSAAAPARPSRNFIGRLYADGTVESDFNPGATANVVYSLSVQSDGKVVAGGDFSGLGGGTGATARNNLGRLNVDGSVDAAFNPRHQRHRLRHRPADRRQDPRRRIVRHSQQSGRADGLGTPQRRRLGRHRLHRVGQRHRPRDRRPARWQNPDRRRLHVARQRQRGRSRSRATGSRVSTPTARSTRRSTPASPAASECRSTR